jgi:hypothetical protein
MDLSQEEIKWMESAVLGRGAEQSDKVYQKLKKLKLVYLEKRTGFLKHAAHESRTVLLTEKGKLELQEHKEKIKEYL